MFKVNKKDTRNIDFLNNSFMHDSLSGKIAAEISIGLPQDSFKTILPSDKDF